MNMRHHSFGDGAALALRLAGDVAAAIEQRLERDGTAAIVVSGGRTPAPFLHELARRSIDWSYVQVMLADERCVPAGDAASNQKMVQHAFAGTPAAASMLLLDASAPDAAAQWQARLDARTSPFAAVVLGMGEDGHFASLFPGMPGLAEALDPGGPRAVLRGTAPVEPRSRISLTLAALLDTDLLALHVTGAVKLETLRRASTPGSAFNLPVRALLQQTRVPLDIYHSA